ncbi:MAG: pyridoxal phosphate-dependent aminotransferase [Alphaproteobacteria bacterium]|nr:pyridoxal phosphate-dependent aminotransferase [Alphaproteobacteria bacterium]
MRFAPRVADYSGPGSGGWSVQQEAAVLRDSGHDVIFLTIGDPDQPTPSPVIEATIAALRRGRTGYGSMVGHPQLRAAVAARFASRTGRPCAAENVTVTTGAQGGLYCAMQCLVGPGDEVIVPEPAYATYQGVLAASGAEMVMVPLPAERGFHPDLDSISGAVTPRTRVVWINSPHNPTGAVFTPDEIAGIAEICRRHDLWLVSDEVYEDLAFARPHLSPWSLPDMAERTIVVSSLSKSHSMPGFRLGWIIGPPALGRHLFVLLLSMTYGTPPFIQEGALAALSAELPEVAALRDDYRRRAGLMSGILAAAPNCRPIPLEGGMFVLLDIRGTGMAAQQFASALLESEDVAVLPCDAFGPSAAGHLRISLTEPDARLAEAGRRIVRFAQRLAGGR